MKDAERIERQLKMLRYEQSEDSRKRVLRKVTEALERNKERTSATRPAVWRIIMNSRITKLAAAAVIIIAVMSGVHFLGGSIDGTSVAWGDVVEQINNYTKYKYRERVVRPKGPQMPIMDVYHLNLSQRRQEVENGDIHIIDMRGEDAITVELRPAARKAIVTKLVGFGPRKDPHIIEMVKRFELDSTERLGTKERNGKVLCGFRHKPNEYNDFTVWVDPKTKLPVEIELKHPQRGQTIFMDEFEYDVELEPSAFSTEIPDGYEVETLTQYYGAVEAKEVAAEYIRSMLNHRAYTIEKLPWMEKTVTIEALDPLGSKALVYMTGIRSSDGNTIIIVQGNYYDAERMVWIPEQQLTLETAGGVKLYEHPKGSTYSQRFLERFSKANSEFFDYKNLSEECFTKMIVMPDGTVMSLSANRQISNKRLQELVGALVEIKAN